MNSSFDIIPDESLVVILDYCSPQDLAKCCELVCHRWRRCISSKCFSSTWLRHARNVWVNTGWTYNIPPHLPPRMMIERLGEVPLRHIRRALVRYDTAGLVEREGWIKTLRAKLLYGTSICTRSPMARGWCVPDWAIRINDAKATFLLAQLEVKRTTPLEFELIRQKWDLIYKHEEQDNNENQQMIFEMEFSNTNEVTASSHPGVKFTWNLIRGNDNNNGRRTNNIPGLQIEDFPMHIFNRLDNGLWTISNDHVLITQRVVPYPNEVPLDLSPS
jgi:hypothetical protein